MDPLSNVDRTAAGPSAPAGLGKGAEAPTDFRQLAAQFESMLLGEMMRELRRSMFEDGDDQSTAPLGDALFAELTLALSRAGGLGIGEALTGPLARQAGEDANAAAAAITGSGGMLPMTGVTGTAPAIDTPAIASMRGRVTSAYGWREDPINGARKFHKGADIAMPIGQDVPAARAGTVTFAGTLPGYGLTVVVDHGGQMSTRYAHLSETGVAVGDTVAAGQTIARSGASGRATGPHLHFEVLESGQAVDPRGFLNLPVQESESR
ncbi:MAG TPA: M23 family metallopeptidase [Vicinamibacterales bacterium]|nr:M23 family metallopeptidase [Vicinamibacterales bacterium]